MHTVHLPACYLGWPDVQCHELTVSLLLYARQLVPLTLITLTHYYIEKQIFADTHRSQGARGLPIDSHSYHHILPTEIFLFLCQCMPHRCVILLVEVMYHTSEVTPMQLNCYPVIPACTDHSST